jgi:hypothetical protein
MTFGAQHRETRASAAALVAFYTKWGKPDRAAHYGSR